MVKVDGLACVIEPTLQVLVDFNQDKKIEKQPAKIN